MIIKARNRSSVHSLTHSPLTRSPNFCCSSACFPMCSWAKRNRHHDLSPRLQPSGSLHTQQPLTIHEPQLQSSRSSFGQVSSSLSGYGPAGKQYQGFPRPGMPPYSNLPPRSWNESSYQGPGAKQAVHPQPSSYVCIDAGLSPLPTCALMRATRKLFRLSNMDFSNRHS